MPPHASTAEYISSSPSYSVVDEKYGGSQSDEHNDGMGKFQRKKQVLFAPVMEKVHEVPNISEYSEEEKSNVWLTGEDMDEIRAENRSLCMAFLAGTIAFDSDDGESDDEDGCDDDDDDVESLRGLEQYFPDVVSERKSKISFARFVVLRTQRRAHQFGQPLDPMHIAILYKNACAKSVESARARGLADFHDVPGSRCVAV